jgi:hypothetical protein
MDLFLFTAGGDCARSASFGWICSTDRGQHWGDLANYASPPFNNFTPYCCNPDGPLAISPANPRRLYLEVNPTDSGYALYMARSDDTGAHWRIVESDGLSRIDGQGVTPFTRRLLADPANQQVVYMALPGPDASRWARSEDSGATWHLLVAPGPDPQATFLLSTDRHLPQVIVAQITGGRIPADRRYLSTDHGRTWKPITCPGDWRGQCPAFTLDDAFGAGHAYGFYSDGVRAFTGGGPAGTRLALSARLPCTLSTLIDAAGGGKAALLLCQDPKVALATGPNVTPELLNNPNLSGLLYRGADGGRSWQRVTPEVSPPIPTAVPIQQGAVRITEARRGGDHGTGPTLPRGYGVRDRSGPENAREGLPSMVQGFLPSVFSPPPCFRDSRWRGGRSRVGYRLVTPRDR